MDKRQLFFLFIHIVVSTIILNSCNSSYENSECASPCWQNITPGISNQEETIIFFEVP